MIHPLIVICKQILEVRTYGTSSLFSLSAQEPRSGGRGGNFFFFLWHCENTLASKKRHIKCFGMVSIRRHEEAMNSWSESRTGWLRWVETGPRTLPFRCVTSACGNTLLQSACLRLCRTPFFFFFLYRMKRDLLDHSPQDMWVNIYPLQLLAFSSLAPGT